MLRRLLAGLSVASLLVGVVLLVLWWRSYRHVDHFTFGWIDSNQTTLTTRDGMIFVTTTRDLGGMISRRSTPYPFWRALLGCLTIPALWLAITIRGKLPRPGRMRLR